MVICSRTMNVSLTPGELPPEIRTLTEATI
jgi:hypothetical protein